MSIFTLAIYEDIASWKQEAKDEDNLRYFFPTPEAELLRSGQKAFLISRKGSGKTAIGQQILKNRGPETFATSLSFKHHPFNNLYARLRDSSFRRPNHFISGWRFVIYCSIARMMGEDPSVGWLNRRIIRRLFAQDVRLALSSTIDRWIAGSANFRIWHFGLGARAARQFMNNELGLAERADLLRTFVMANASRSKYYIVFDELDEDYTSSSDEKERAEYFALLTSLLKAVNLVREEFKNAGANIFPIVLLRDDIFDKLEDPDRSKWTDHAVMLSWTTDRIKEMLAFRLSRAANLEVPMNFSEIWGELVGKFPTFSTSKEWDKFDFIASYTLLRPRDFIFYLSDASKRIAQKIKSGTANRTLTGTVLRECVRDFADHLKKELVDEIGGQIPYINDVMEMILRFEERHFSLADFRSAYVNAATNARDKPWTLSADSVLEQLYLFSVIGFVSGTREVFRYRNPNVDLDSSRKMLLHKGLLGARRAVA